jgi:hypothetical protein
VVKESDVPRAVRSLHQHFFPSKSRRTNGTRHAANGAAKPKKESARESKATKSVLAEKKAAIRPGLSL